MAVVIKVGETEAVSVDIGEKVYIQGDPGFSPTIEVADITGGHCLTITDINGDKTVDVMNGAKGDTGATGNGIEYITLNADYTLTVHYTNGTEWTSDSIRGEEGKKGDTGDTGATFQPSVSEEGDLSWTNDKGKPNPPTVNIKGPEGQPGQTGATPDISIGTVTTGAAGSQAEATMTGTPERPVLNLTIPRGDPGEVTQAEFDELSGEVTQQKSAIEDLQDLTNLKAGMLVDTASGAIASFVPDATVPNLLGVTVAIEPVQDLHGYDSPWPAGGGKNKLHITATTTTNNGVTFTVNADGSVSCAGTATATAVLRMFQTFSITEDVILNGCPSGGNYNNRYSLFAATGSGSSVTPNASVDIGSGVTIPAQYVSDIEQIQIIVRSGANMDGKVFYPMIRLATVTDPTYSPYENICPISGWDSVEVDATGINMWDEEWEQGGISISNGQNVLVTNAIRSADYCSCVPNTDYYVAGAYIYKYVFWYDEDKNFLSYRPSASLVTSPANAKYFRLRIDAYGTTYNHDISVNYPATDHAYHPYAGNRYTIQLGDTIYGAKLTIAEDGSVTALVDRAKIVFDGTQPVGIANWRVNAQSAAWLYRPETVPGIMLEGAHIISDTLPTVDYQTMWNATSSCISNVPGDLWALAMRFNDTTLTTETAINAYLADNPVTVIYELATPIVIDLDPVTISTISGQPNNVWADAGDVAVEYAADLKTYIDSKIAAAVAALS